MLRICAVAALGCWLLAGCAQSRTPRAEPGAEPPPSSTAAKQAGAAAAAGTAGAAARPAPAHGDVTTAQPAVPVSEKKEEVRECPALGDRDAFSRAYAAAKAFCDDAHGWRCGEFGVEFDEEGCATEFVIESINREPSVDYQTCMVERLTGSCPACYDAVIRPTARSIDGIYESCTIL